jgi:hypothetical protein
MRREGGGRKGMEEENRKEQIFTSYSLSHVQTCAKILKLINFFPPASLVHYMF